MGNPLTESAIGNPYFFTGRRYDKETGLYYYRARYYSPELGRFLQHDPLGYVDGWNLFEYCFNDPVNWIDPWGLFVGGSTSSDVPNPVDYLPPMYVSAVDQQIVGLEDQLAGIKQGDFLWGKYVQYGYNKYTSLPNMQWKWNSAYEKLQGLIKTLKEWLKKLLGGGDPDPNETDDQWKELYRLIEDATGKRYQGGKSIEVIEKNNKGGRRVWHWIERNGKPVHGPHIRK